MIYLIVGTRPEVLKMAPIVRAFKKSGEPHTVIAIYQHTDLLDQVLGEVDDNPIMLAYPQGPTFADLYTSARRALEDEDHPRELSDLVLVQGDTNTALAGALAAWHLRIPVGHVEGGLRSSRRDRPFPEEGNRRLISQLADIHFCPTVYNADEVYKSGAPPSSLHITGATSVDQLRRSTERYDIRVANGLVAPVEEDDRPWIFVTVHRRENLEHLGRITEQMYEFAAENPGTVIWPVHPNSDVPHQHPPAPNVNLIPPLTHDQAVVGIRFADLVVTDSGGVVEEATTLGKRILVLRDETERPEAIHSGHASLVPAATFGTLAKQMASALLLPALPPSDVFGDGHAGSRIAELAAEFVRKRAAS